MKEKYEVPVMEIVAINAEDIIFASPNCPDDLYDPGHAE